MTHSMAPSDESHGSKLDTALDTASPMPHQAAEQVFATPELLCGIAAHLSRKETFVAMGVCRTWRSTLSGDLTTQQALFLKPREIHEVIAPNRYILDLEHPIPIEECTIIGDVNPFVYDICGHTHLGRSLYPSVNTEFLHRGGLWREMFVTQPPCKIITVHMYSELDADISHRLNFGREAGIKMGELFDFIDEEMRYHPECSGSYSHVDNFDTAEEARDLPWDTTRCMVRDGEVCRPAQIFERRVYAASECSQDIESNDSHDGHDGHDGSQGVVGGYEDYESESGEEYSDDDEDPDEFAAEEADEADQYFRW